MKPKKMKFVRFLEGSKDALAPVEARKVIPGWYKDLAPYRAGTSNDLGQLNPVNDRGGDGSDVSTKLCNPFIDSLTMGYSYLLEGDVHVSLDEHGLPVISWDSETHLIDTRPFLDIAIPSDCHPIHFGLKMHWYYETPPGYSVLITHSLNRWDLPFYVGSGVVDSDIWGLPAFIPLFIKKGFVGTIPRGTPMFQMIPIKRDEWELDVDTSSKSAEYHNILEEKRRTHITGHYRKTTWQKKRY
jgi:hypothetical protein